MAYPDANFDRVLAVHTLLLLEQPDEHFARFIG